MTEIIQQIRMELEQAAQVENALENGRRLSTPTIRAISRDCFKQVSQLNKDRIFSVCEGMLESRVDAERVIAFDWAFRCRKHFEETDFERFEGWLREYVGGWGSCDDFCTHAFGSLIYRVPGTISKVIAWTKSENRWLRRAAAVVLIYSVRRGAHVEFAFRIADILLLDRDDMAQKGYGWMLKELSKRKPMEVFGYVMKNKEVMPRTSLRYAIEKLGPSLRAQAMSR